MMIASAAIIASTKGTAPRKISPTLRSGSSIADLIV